MATRTANHQPEGKTGYAWEFSNNVIILPPPPTPPNIKVTLSTPFRVTSFLSLSLSHPHLQKHTLPYRLHFSINRPNYIKQQLKVTACACACACVVCVCFFCTIRSNKDELRRYATFLQQIQSSYMFRLNRAARTRPCVFFFFPFHWLYIPGWDLTCSLSATSFPTAY